MDQDAAWKGVELRWPLLALIAGTLVSGAISSSRVTGELAATAWGALPSYCLLILWLLWRTAVDRSLIRNALGRRLDVRQLVGAVLTGVCVSLATREARAIRYLVSPSTVPTPEELSHYLDGVLALRPLLTVLFIVIVIGPVLEELVVRGAILARLTARFGGVAGSAASLALFALLHTAVLWALLLGFVLTRLVLNTRNLRAPIWAHAVCNATTIIWSALYMPIPAGVHGDTRVDVALRILLLAGFVGGVVVSLRLTKCAPITKTVAKSL